MSDDIVEYLRLSQTRFNRHAEAADEIERLRADLNNASAKANAYYELVQAYRWSHAHLNEWPDAICSLVAENYELRKAVNGQ